MLRIQKPRFGGAFFYVDADTLYAFKSRGFGGEIGLGVFPDTSKDLGSYQAFDSPHSSIICCFSVCTASAAAFPSTMLKPADLSLMQFCCGDRYQ